MKGEIVTVASETRQSPRGLKLVRQLAGTRRKDPKFCIHHRLFDAVCPTCEFEAPKVAAQEKAK